MSLQKPLLVAVVGVGLVGSEFISQLLSIPSPSPLKLISLTSSKRTLTLDLTSSSTPQLKSEWKSLLSSSSLPADLQSLTQRLATLVSQDKERVILVDNTSSDAVAALYPTWLAQGINVVTPNKKAYSGDLQLWKDILDASSRQGGGRYLNEATVGAGLPVISTLKELLGTGDRIIKIEGVFSGTMSYIFNEFSTGSEDGPAFSSVVSVAREKGYTVCYSPSLTFFQSYDYTHTGTTPSRRPKRVRRSTQADHPLAHHILFPHLFLPANPPVLRLRENRFPHTPRIGRYTHGRQVHRPSTRA